MRKYQAMLIAATGVVVAALAAYGLYGGGKGPALIGGPFALVDHENRPRTDADFRGSFMLVYFGYTYCPDICPTALQIMTAAIDRLEKPRQDRITPIFITVDPERDTPAHLASYVENFHPRMVGLTGSSKQIAAAARAYRVYYGKGEGDGDDYLMDHSSIVFLMDPDGGYLTHFTHATAPERVAEKLREHVRG